jgi:hypothetical protein
MRYWAGLYPEETQRAITNNVNLMVLTTLRILKRQCGSPTLRIIEAEEEDDQAGGDLKSYWRTRNYHADKLLG